MFWLELDEVQQVFDCGWSCKLYDPEMWTTQRRAAAFPDQGGGCLNQTTWVANPQFFLDLPHKTPVQLTLTQNGTHAIGLCVVRQDRGDDGAAVDGETLGRSEGMDDVGGAVVGTRVGLREGLDDGTAEGCGVGIGEGGT